MASPPTCSVADCEKPVLVKSRGLCTTHYHRWVNHGDPGITLRNREYRRRPFDTCSVDGCDRPFDSHGFCKVHAWRLKRYGDPLGLPEPRGKSATERYWPKVDVSGGPDACWPWIASLNARTGYPTGFYLTRTPPVRCYPHRFAVMLDGREIPDGHIVHHVCGNRSCCNPTHLVVIPKRQHDAMTTQERWDTNGAAAFSR